MIKIGVICPSEIAFRRFMPALAKNENFQFIGIGVSTAEEWQSALDSEKKNISLIASTESEKAQKFIDAYGGKIFSGYKEIIQSEEIDAIYIPLPPALHHKWAKLAFDNNKHVFLEKPSTTKASLTSELISLASSKNLALHENYMFAFHSQINTIKEMLLEDTIGEVRLYRISFGFPKRAQNDFRYNKALGGGALLDAGGYTIKCAALFLGDKCKIVQAQMNYIQDFEVDIYGSGVMKNNQGITAQIAFGMDNNYRCDLEVWGSKGHLSTNRILTAPDGFSPFAIIRNDNEEKQIQLPSDDTFSKSLQWFHNCILNEKTRKESYDEISKQADLVETFRTFAGFRE